VERLRGRGDSLHSLARIVALIGLAILVVGAALPWGNAGPGDTYGAFDHFGDGFLSLVCGVSLVALLFGGGARDSRTRTVQLLPAILGVATFLLALAGFRSVEAWIHGLERMGQRPTFETGIYLTLVGGAVEALAGLVSSVVTVRSVAVWRNEGAEDRAFARDFFGRLLVGGVLVIGGAVGGSLLGLQVPGRLPNSFLMLLLALIGGTIGAYIANRLWERGHPDRATIVGHQRMDG
jgi:hypothetical protein